MLCSALFLLWSTSSFLCSRIYDAQLTKAYGTDRTQNGQPELKNSWKWTTQKKGAGKPACPVGWPACPVFGASWPAGALGRLAGQWRTGLAGLLGLGPRNSSQKFEVGSNGLQKFPQFTEMILRCIRWYPQRIKPHKLWKWNRSEYPSREVGFSQEILPRVKNCACGESTWFIWQGCSFDVLSTNSTQQNNLETLGT